MKEMNKNNLEDIHLKKILPETKITAGDNLKFRIMQQIETEKILSKKAKSSFSILNNMFTIFGVMYAIIAVIAGFVYFSAGKAAVESTYMYLFIILVTSVCSAFWMVSIYDEKRRKKK